MFWFISIVLAVLSVCLLLCAGVALLAYKGYHSRLAQDELIKQLNEKLKMVQHSTIGVGSRLLGLEAQCKRLAGRQDSLEHRDPEVAQFAQAQKMITLGATVDELIETCGLSRAEASLIAKLNTKPVTTADEWEC